MTFPVEICGADFNSAERPLGKGALAGPFRADKVALRDLPHAAKSKGRPSPQRLRKMNLREEERLRQRSQSLLQRLESFVQQEELYDIQALIGSPQQQVGEFYDYRLGMEPVYKLRRVYSGEDGRLNPLAPTTALNTEIFKITKGLEQAYSDQEGVDVVVESAGTGRVAITLYFGL